jgi:hypothetical protein
MGALNWLNPYTGQVENGIMVALADHTEMQTLHMVTTDPFRTPTFTPFADPDWFFFATGGSPPATCATPAACAFIPARTNSSFAWNHGDIQDEIASTWVGYVGPGVRNLGATGAYWTDHTDVRPTILTLVGLSDDYDTDGRTVFQALYPWAVPVAVSDKAPQLAKLEAAYKQLTAPFGEFGMQTLRASTTGLESGSSSDDSTYTSTESSIQSLTSQRDSLAATIRSAINGAEFRGAIPDSQDMKSWTSQANDLIAQATALAGP